MLLFVVHQFPDGCRIVFKEDVVTSKQAKKMKSNRTRGLRGTNGRIAREMEVCKVSEYDVSKFVTKQDV